MPKRKTGDKAAPTHMEKLTPYQWGQLKQFEKEQREKNFYGNGAVFASAGKGKLHIDKDTVSKEDLPPLKKFDPDVPKRCRDHSKRPFWKPLKSDPTMLTCRGDAFRIFRAFDPVSGEYWSLVGNNRRYRGVRFTARTRQECIEEAERLLFNQS